MFLFKLSSILACKLLPLLALFHSDEVGERDEVLLSEVLELHRSATVIDVDLPFNLVFFRLHCMECEEVSTAAHYVHTRLELVTLDKVHCDFMQSVQWLSQPTTTFDELEVDILPSPSMQVLIKYMMNILAVAVLVLILASGLRVEASFDFL